MPISSPSPTLIAGTMLPETTAPSISSTLFCWQTYLLLFVLLFPTKLFNEFYIAASVAITLCCLQTKAGGSRTAFLLIGFEIYLLTTSVLRSLTFPSAGVPMQDNMRDYFELARLLPPIVIFVFVDRWRSLRPEHFLWAFSIFLALDGVVTFLQRNHRDFYGLQEFAANYYNVEHHLNIALNLDGRAPGLSTGPGQHAASLGVSMVVMLNAIFVSPRFTTVGFVGVFTTAILLACAQSQTGLIVVSLTVCGLLAMHILKGTSRQRTLALTLFAALGLSATTLLGLISQFSYLNSLFTVGLTRNSYVVRQETRQYVLEQMARTPQWYAIGHGKEYFGGLSGAMDNEYLYVLAVYGLPIVIFFAFAVPLLVIRLALFTPRLTSDYWNLTLLGLLTLGLGFAWPSSFFTEPRSMVIFSLVFATLQSNQLGQRSRSPMLRQHDIPLTAARPRPLVATRFNPAARPSAVISHSRLRSK